MMLGVQILTGVILAMHYTPEATMAFKSVESIVRGRELRLAAAQYSRQRRVDVLSRGFTSTCSAACITGHTRSRAKSSGFSASSSTS